MIGGFMAFADRISLKHVLVVVAVLGCLSGARAQEAAPPKAKPLALFMGSSTIDYWKTLPEDFPGYRTVNVGVAGTKYTYLVDHIDQWMKEIPADVIVIYSGDNDVAWGSSPDGIAANLERVLKSIRAIRPHVPVVVVSIKPGYNLWRRFKLDAISETNGRLAAVAKNDPKARFVDVYSKMLNERGRANGAYFGADGIHMNASGYGLWKASLAPVLDQAFRAGEAAAAAGAAAAAKPQ